MTTNIKLNGENLESKIPIYHSTIDRLSVRKGDIVVIRTTLPVNLQRAKAIRYMKDTKQRVERALKESGHDNTVVVMDGNNTSLQVMTAEDILLEKI